MVLRVRRWRLRAPRRGLPGVGRARGGRAVAGGRASAERCVIEVRGGTAAVAVKGGGNFEMVEGSGMLLRRTRPPDSQPFK